MHAAWYVSAVDPCNVVLGGIHVPPANMAFSASLWQDVAVLQGAGQRRGTAGGTVEAHLNPAQTLPPAFAPTFALMQDDIHDGVNYVRTACVIAVSKSKDIFEPLIHQVGATQLLPSLLPMHC
jgi:hypothetical protein